MKPDKIYIILIILLMFSLGCLSFEQPSLQVDYYILEYDRPDLTERPPLAEAIQIKRFQTSPFYDTQNIIYSEKEFSKKAYHYHKWQSTPGTMVSTLLARDLLNYNMFSAVLTDISSLSADYTLEGKVDEFFEIDESDQWKAVLSLSIAFSRKDKPNASEGMLLQKSYSIIEVCENKHPESLAAALSLAMSKISQQIAIDIYETAASY